MTKRFGNFQNSNGKRPKLDDEEIWDDDLDDDALDKCFELATQLCKDDLNSTQLKDVSILPSYSVFKNPTGFSSSTQTNVTATASTSKKLTFTELEAELQVLKIQNEEKDGEISILRSKIKETNNSVHAEQQKTTYEWREKLLQTQREARLVKSDLEFKNLEIANLKQQLVELRRINLDATLNSTQQFVAHEPHPESVVKVNLERPVTHPKKDSVEESVSIHRESIVDSVYPLKCISPDNFEEIEENHVIKTTSYKFSRNTIPYLQNQQTYNESSFQHKCARLGNKKIDLKCIYSDVIKLVNSNSEELNRDDCIEAVNKIICVTIILLQDLNEYLVEYGSNLRAEDIEQADTNYLLNSQESQDGISFKRYENELGIQSGKILEVLSQLILYSSYAADFVCGNKSLKVLNNIKEYVKLIPHRNGTMENDYYLLNLLLTIVKNVGIYRLANQMNFFLMSVISVLINIGKLDNEDYINKLMIQKDLFCSLFKEIVFVRPGSSTIQAITRLLKMGSRYKIFVQYLFGKNGKNPLLKTDPKGVLYYNEDACSFCVLSILLQNYLSKIKTIPLEVCENMVAFIYNTFKTSHWIHHETTGLVCGCLSQLYKLEMEFVFRALKEFVECFNEQKENSHVSHEWKTFFQHSIVQKVLNQMNFNNFELTEKYVMVYSQFKEIEFVLKNEGLFNTIEFNTSEELVKIAIEKFKPDF